MARFIFRLFQLSVCRVELVKFLPVHRFSVDIFHILVLREYWVLAESRKSLKLVLGALELLHSIKPSSLLFSNIVGSLYF